MAFNADDADAGGADPAWYVKVYRSTDMEFWNRNEHALLGQRYVRDALARLVPGLPSAQPGDLGVADAFLDECVPDAFDNIGLTDSGFLVNPGGPGDDFDSTTDIASANRGLAKWLGKPETKVLVTNNLVAAGKIAAPVDASEVDASQLPNLPKKPIKFTPEFEAHIKTGTALDERVVSDLVSASAPLRAAIHTAYKSIVLVEVPDSNLIAGLASFFTGDATLRRLWDTNLATKTMRPKTDQVRIEPRQPCPRAPPDHVIVPSPNTLCAWLSSTSRSCTCCRPCWTGATAI